MSNETYKYEKRPEQETYTAVMLTHLKASNARVIVARLSPQRTLYVHKRALFLNQKPLQLKIRLQRDVCPQTYVHVINAGLLALGIAKE